MTSKKFRKYARNGPSRLSNMTDTILDVVVGHLGIHGPLYMVSMSILDPHWFRIIADILGTN